MDICCQQIERQNYADALKQLIQIFKNEINAPNLNTIYLINKILSQSQNYKSVQLKLLELLSPEINQEEKYFNLIFDLINLYIDQNNYAKAQAQLKQLKQYILNVQNNVVFMYMIEHMEKLLQSNKKNTNEKTQLEIFEELRKQENTSNYFDGMPVFLIPERWITKWRSFVTETPIQSNNNCLNIKNEIDAMVKILNISNDLNVKEQIMHPGPINGFTLIYVKQFIELDQFEPKKYTNYLIKENLREGIDYIKVAFKTYEYLKNIYGGFDVQRMVVKLNHLEKGYVDLVLRQIKFMFLPTDHESNIRLIAASNKDYISDLTQKIQRIFGIQNQVRWWKFINYDEQNKFMQNKNSKFVNGYLLNNSTQVEEINFNESDIFICEINFNNNNSDLFNYEITNQKEDQSLKSQINNNTNPLNLKQEYSNNKHQKINYFEAFGQIHNDNDDNNNQLLIIKSGLIGLQNLGNTSFMNSVLQCLSHTYELTDFVLSNEFQNQINKENPLGTKGLLASAYSDLMKSIWFNSASFVSPHQLKSVIHRFAPQFCGYGQHDSHELLNYLLDGLHEDLNRVKQKAIVQNFEIANEPDTETSLRFWNNYLLRNQSKIQELMVGQYKQTIICPNCQLTSKSFDPFISLSLPIPAQTLIHITLYFIYQKESTPLKIQLNVNSNQDMNQISQELSKVLNVSEDQMNFILIKDHTIISRVQKNTNIKQLLQIDGQLFIFQIEKEYYSLQDYQIHVEFYFCLPRKNFNQNYEIITYPRQCIVSKNDQILDLFQQIYKQFKPLFMLILEEGLPFLKENIKMDHFNQQIPQTQDEFIEEMNLYKEFPFKLIYNDIELSIDSTETIESLNQKLLSIYVVLNPLFTKEDKIHLKFQRCQDFQIEQDTKQKNEQYSLDDCLKQFVKQEILEKGDEWYCSNCKTHVQAARQMEIYKAPQILIIHLQRFRLIQNNSQYFNKFITQKTKQKIAAMVHFPKNLNLNKHILSKLNNNDPIDYTYELYGVQNHYGDLAGHYTSYVYNSIIKRWVDYDDLKVNLMESDIESKAAYLLFYRRNKTQQCNL